MEPIHGRLIWKCPKPFNRSSSIPHADKCRVELCDLIRFKDYWYCGFQEGPTHLPHPDNRILIIRSKDGHNWELVRAFKWDGGNMHEPRFSMTAEGMLMIDCILRFISREPRINPNQQAEKVTADALPPSHPDHKKEVPAHKYYQLDSPRVPESDSEAGGVAWQSVTWLTADGLDWGSVHACESGVNGGRWSTTWHNGMGYSVAYGGKDIGGTLYRTRDGRRWRALKADFFPPEGKGILNETSLTFRQDNTAICLTRGSGRPGAPPLCGPVILGIGKAPYYTEWEWKTPKLDWDGDGRLAVPGEILRAPFGGPKMIRLEDGRFVAAGRVLGPGQDDGTISLFLVDAQAAVLRRFADVWGNTYAGIVEHEGRLWVACLGRDCEGIVLAEVPLPS